MKRTIALLAAAALCVACPAYAFWSIGPGGTWPKSWPKEMEPLRKQAWTLVGGIANLTLYEIPFTKREEFESAWPHILKVRSKGAPVILVRSRGNVEAPPSSLAMQLETRQELKDEHAVNHTLLETLAR